jgi:16S rRNA (guanine966-N2)-methyltransferase
MARKLLPGELRIIAGLWRGRKINFPAISGLRPTPDRVRETLFNWLAPIIAGARCLDLFAGSGALGLEALSRGADHVQFVDYDPRVIKHLRAYLHQFAITKASLFQGNSALSLPQMTNAFDIVFIDPPFRQGLILPCLQWLQQPGWLSAEALIYLEVEVEFNILAIPISWKIVRNKQAGQVRYLLIKQAINVNKGS